MSGREAVLARIRAALGRRGPAGAAATEAAQAHLARREVGPRTTFGVGAAERFVERAEGLASTCERIDSLGQAPGAVARYLAAHGLPSRGVCWPRYGDLDWRSEGLAVEARAAVDGDLVGITGAFCAIADTGTLMLLSGPETPAATSLLPETHIALVPLARIVAFMEDGWRLLREEGNGLPRAVNFVSGPSRTADIEQTVTLGAHGPYRVHIILVAR